MDVVFFPSDFLPAEEKEVEKMGLFFDDHWLEDQINQAGILLGYFRKEFDECKKVKDCPSYPEVRALLKVLNTGFQYVTQDIELTPNGRFTVSWALDEGWHQMKRMEREVAEVKEKYGRGKNG